MIFFYLSRDYMFYKQARTQCMCRMITTLLHELLAAAAGTVYVVCIFIHMDGNISLKSKNLENYFITKNVGSLKNVITSNNVTVRT